MNTPDVLKAIAKRLREADLDLFPDSFGGVQYPQPNKIPGSPYIVLLDGSSAGPTVVQRGMSGHEVTAQATIRILVKSHKETPREATRIDTLIAPVLDALDPVRHGGAANMILPDLTGHIDRIWDTATIVRGATEEYAGEFCHAADIGIDPFFTRPYQE